MTQDGEQDLDLDLLRGGFITITAQHFGQTLPPFLSLSHTLTPFKIPLKLTKCSLSEVRNGYVTQPWCEFLEIV